MMLTEPSPEMIATALQTLDSRNMNEFRLIYRAIWFCDCCGDIDEIWKRVLENDDVEALTIMIDEGPTIVESTLEVQLYDDNTIIEYAMRQTKSYKCTSLLWISGATFSNLSCTCLEMCLHNPNDINFQRCLEAGCDIFARWNLGDESPDISVADLLVTMRSDFQEIAIEWIVYQWCVGIILTRMLQNVPPVLTHIMETYLITEEVYLYSRGTVVSRKRHRLEDNRLYCTWTETCLEGDSSIGRETRAGAALARLLRLDNMPPCNLVGFERCSVDYQKWYSLAAKHNEKLRRLESAISERVRHVLITM